MTASRGPIQNILRRIYDAVPAYRLYLFVVVSIFICITLLQGVRFVDDSPSYLYAMQSIQGKVTYDPFFLQDRIVLVPLLTNPATLYLGAWIGYVTGAELFGLLIVNILLFYVAVFFVYKTAYLLFHSKEYSLLTATFFSANHFILYYGIGSYLTDMGGWALYAATIYFVVLFFRTKEPRFAYVAGAVAMVGFFFKETGGIGIASLLAAIALVDMPVVQKIRIALICCSMFTVNILYHIHIYLSQGYSYLDRYINVATEYIPAQSVLNTAKVLGSLFFVGWPAAAYGLCSLLKTRIANREMLKILFIISISSISFMAYPAQNVRLAAILLLLLSLLAVQGLRFLNTKIITYSVLCIYILTNVFAVQLLALI